MTTTTEVAVEAADQVVGAAVAAAAVQTQVVLAAAQAEQARIKTKHGNVRKRNEKMILALIGVI